CSSCYLVLKPREPNGSSPVPVKRETSADRPVRTVTENVLAPGLQQPVESTLSGADFFEARIAQAALIVDIDVAETVSRLDEQFDRLPVGLGSGDRIPDAVVRIGGAVYRDDLVRHGQPGVEGGTVPNHGGHPPARADRHAERIVEVDRL